MGAGGEHESATECREQRSGTTIREQSRLQHKASPSWIPSKEGFIREVK